MQQALLVLGMHRSGTSALTRVLSLLGAALPKHLMPPVANNNETGFWEPERLAILHDQMLAEAGSRWDDWRSFDIAVLARPRAQFYRAEIVRLIEEEYGEAPLFVLKEPRICRFTGFYADILASMKIEARTILATRNPLAVMASLAARDGFTPGYSALLWLRHALDAEHATRDIPRMFLSYEELMRDWRAGVDKAARALSMSWPRSPDEAAAEIEAHLSPQHRHHVASEAQLFADERVTQWVKDAYAALKALEQDDDDTEPLAVLDRVKTEFDATAPIFGDPFYGELAERIRATTDALCGMQKLAQERAAEIGRLGATLQQQNADAAERESVFTEERARLQQLADERLTEINRLGTALQEQSAEMAAREAIFVEEQEKLQQLAQERAAEIGRLSTEVAQRSADFAVQEAAFAQEKMKLQRLADEQAAEIGRLNTRLTEATTDAATSRRQAAMKEQSLQEAVLRLQEQATTITAQEKAAVSERAALHQLYQNSTSWKVTALLRGVRRFASWAARVCRNFALRNVSR